MNRPTTLTTLAAMLSLLTACRAAPVAAPTPTPTPTAARPTTPAPSATPSPSPTPTSTPTLTPFPTSTPVVNTPAEPTPGLPLASEGYFPLGDFFFAGQSADCQFPCWYGLRPGESTPQETQRVLKSLFGSDPTVRLSGDGSLLVMAYEWHNAQYSDGSLFAIGANSWTSDNRLAAIAFIWNVFYIPDFTVDMSPQRVLHEMGPPAKLLVSVDELVGGQDAIMTLLILYSNGVSYSYIRHSAVESPGRVVKLCLRAPTEADEPGGERLLVANPLEDVTDPHSLFRELLLGETLDPAKMDAFESVFGVTPEQVASMAGQDAPLCFYSK